MTPHRFRAVFAWAALIFLAALPARSQLVTNWTAFNDHRRGTTTGPNVTTYDMRGTAERGALQDHASGVTVPARLLVSDVGGDGSDDFGACADPDLGTPADLLFGNIVDVGGAGGDGIIGLRNGEVNVVTLTFTNLDPSRKYYLIGTSVRGNNYNDRWAIYTLEGAVSFEDAHVDASANNNLLTPGEFAGASVGPGQVALNSGENRVGSLVGWRQIDPGPDGGFTIRQAQYIGTAPFGNPSAGPYGYALNAMVLMEVGPPEPVSFVQQPPAQFTVTEARPLTLSVVVRGAPLPTVQWLKDGSAIPGATSPTLTIPRATLNDGGNYQVVAQNSLGSLNSSVCRVTVNPDTEAPRVLRAVPSASFDKVLIEYDELIDGLTGGDNLNYVLEGPAVLGIVSATVNPSGDSVTLTLSGPMGEAESYKVIIDNVQDLTQVNTIPHTEVPFRSWVRSSCGPVLFEAFNGTAGPATAGTIAGNAVSILTSHPSFPDHPSEVRRLSLNGFDSREAYPDDTHEGYGGRMRALFIPPYSGAWRLYLRSDDSSELWVNANGPSATGRALVAQETGCCGAFMSPGDPRTTPPMNLIAGQAYYLEALWKEGTGGDLCQVAAKLESDTNAPASLLPIPKDWLASAVSPGLLGTFTIAQQPANAQVPDGTAVSFKVRTSPDVPVCYQWLRDGVEIPDATGPSYSLVPVLGDNGAKFSVRISVPGGETLSSTEALLTVARDTVLPVALSAVPAVGGASVLLSFSEPVDPATSENPANYTLDGLNVISATRSNGTNVTLVPAATLAPCVDHLLLLRNVTDLSANVLTPNPTSFTFVTPIVLVANSDTQMWKYDNTGTDLQTAWLAPGFDDGLWPSGAGAIGFEDASTMPPGWTIRTTLTDFAVTKITMYMRTHFELPTHPSTITRLELREVVDDGSASYINGVPVNSNRVPASPYFDTLAGGAPSEAPHPVEVFVLPTSSLHQGDNVLAVEVHQTSTSSSDILYGAELVAFVSRCGVGLVITPVSATQARLTWSDASYHLESAASLTGPWSPQPGVASGDLVNITSGNLFYHLVK